MKTFRDRPPIWRRDINVSFKGKQGLLATVEDAESSAAAAQAPIPPNLKRKSAGEPLSVGAPPDLKKRSVDPTEALSALSLFTVDDACMVLIFSKLDPASIAAASCSCKRWRRLAGKERLWEALCHRDWDLTHPRDANLQPATYRDSYISWQRQYGRYGKLAVRMRVAWWVVEAWTAQNLPAVRATLRPGATEAQLNAAEAALGVRLPEVVRALYRVHDGQELPADVVADTTGECQLDSPSTLHGIFGGYSYYDQIVSLRMLPLQRMVLWTQRLRAEIFRTSSGDPRIVFAASFNLKKILVVDSISGLVRVCLANKQHQWDAVPPDLKPGACDGMLRWVEEYAKRLQEGVYGVSLQPKTHMDLGVPPTLAIDLYPQKPPTWTWSVTRGVHVRLSTVFVPENTRGKAIAPNGIEIPPRFCFAYSTRLALLSEREQRECGVARPVARVQLKSRHWRIRTIKGELLDEVVGEGVIGAHPVLQAGGEPFSYQSVTVQQRMPIVLQGEFTFVRGLLSEIDPPQFTARIPTVVLRLPPFTF